MVCFGGWWKFWNNEGEQCGYRDTSRSYRKRDYSVREHEHRNKHDAFCDGTDQSKGREPNTVVVNVAPGISPGGP